MIQYGNALIIDANCNDDIDNYALIMAKNCFGQFIEEEAGSLRFFIKKVFEDEYREKIELLRAMEKY